MKVIIVPKLISSGVFESQLLSLIKNSDASHVCFHSQQQFEKFKSKLNELKVIGILSRTQLFKTIFNIQKVYCRDVFDFQLLFFFKLLSLGKVKITYDFRGLISEESFIRNNSTFRKIILRSFELFAFTFSTSLYCVSNNLKQNLLSVFWNRDVTVIPCCISDNEIDENVSLESKDSNSFIYVGSIASWQCFNDAVVFYKNLELGNKSFKVITKDLTAAREILHMHGVTATILSGDRDFVLNELKSTMYGFVLRDNNLINTTASPIKLLEYTSQGVIPIMTRWVGDYSQVFKDNSVIIDDLNYLSGYESKLNFLKSDFNLASIVSITKLYTWDRHVGLLF
jgi:hypothetical protein